MNEGRYELMYCFNSYETLLTAGHLIINEAVDNLEAEEDEDLE